jgi:transposase
VHSDEFKANAVAACMQSGVSMAAVAMAHGINANLLRRWVRMAEMNPAAEHAAKPPALPAPPLPSFVPMQLPSCSGAPGIRIELRRGATSIAMTWPAESAAECAAWMRELLR